MRLHCILKEQKVYLNHYDHFKIIIYNDIVVM